MTLFGDAAVRVPTGRRVVSVAVASCALNVAWGWLIAYQLFGLAGGMWSAAMFGGIGFTAVMGLTLAADREERWTGAGLLLGSVLAFMADELLIVMLVLPSFA